MFGLDIEHLPTRHGHFYCIRQDSVIGRSIRTYGEWAQIEIEILSSLICDNGVILDIGANIGTHAVGLAALNPRSTVIALEPQPLAYALLSANILSAGVANVFPFNVAAGKRLQLLHFEPDYESIGYNIGGVSLIGARAMGRDGTAMPTTVMRVDDLPIHQPVRLMKIDVEGMEPDVLRGALGMIGCDRPPVFFEVLDMTILRACRNILSKLDYELRWLETPAFNPDNFMQEKENIWSWGEVGVLAMPVPNDPRVVHLPLVTGREKEPPRLAFVP